MNATARLGTFLASYARTPLPPDIRARAAGCLIDTLGIALGARDEATAQAVAGLSGRTVDGSNARQWIDRRPVSLADAVIANTVLAHAHFHDDSCHSSWTHPGSLIVPLAVALGEAAEASVDDVLKSLVAGYVTLAWLGADEAVARPLIRRGFRGSPAFGTIGAAATAAVALGLAAEAATHAIAIAATTTGGILEPVRAGSDEWRLQNARAAHGGLFAALAARAGVRGAPNALEGDRGFLRAFAGLEQAPAAWSEPPDPHAMHHAMAKPYATLGDNMAPTIAAKIAHGEGIDPSRIEAVEVTIWRPYIEYPGVAFKGPFDTVIQALASAPFSVAAMLVHGRLGFDIPDRLRRDPTILRIADLVQLEPHDGEYLDAEIAVTLTDGRVVNGAASRAPRTWIFQDRATATEIFEQRLTTLGRDAASASTLATEIFETSPPIGEILDRLL